MNSHLIIVRVYTLTLSRLFELILWWCQHIVGDTTDHVLLLALFILQVLGGQISLFLIVGVCTCGFMSVTESWSSETSGWEVIGTWITSASSSSVSVYDTNAMHSLFWNKVNTKSRIYYNIASEVVLFYPRSVVTADRGVREMRLLFAMESRTSRMWCSIIVYNNYCKWSIDINFTKEVWWLLGKWCWIGELLFTGMAFWKKRGYVSLACMYTMLQIE